MSARWPFARTADPSAARPDRLLRDNPVLLLSALQDPGTVAGLVAEWNPAWGADPDSAADPRSAGCPDPRSAAHPDPRSDPDPDPIRWHGPLRLTPMLRADAGLPTTGPAASLGLAYAAEVRRERVKIGDSRHADRLRRRYPHGLPAGAEADAWHLVRGLAKRLRGVARLPGGPVHAPHDDPPLPGDADHTVFSHEMLPWIVLREILHSVAPGLAREAVPDGGGYILRRRDLVEVRVRPAGHLPRALRGRAGDGWPRSVYEFRDLSAPSAPPSALRPTGHPRQAGHPRQTSNTTAPAAALIAEVTGGVLLDADGFPREARSFSAR